MTATGRLTGWAPSSAQALNNALSCLTRLPVAVEGQATLLEISNDTCSSQLDAAAVSLTLPAVCSPHVHPAASCTTAKPSQARLRGFRIQVAIDAPVSNSLSGMSEGFSTEHRRGICSAASLRTGTGDVRTAQEFLSMSSVNQSSGPRSFRFEGLAGRLDSEHDRPAFLR